MEPTPGQRIALARTFDCARVVYNDALAVRKAGYAADRSRIPTGELARRVITEAKETPDRAWLGTVAVDALQSSLRDLDMAYTNFFASVSGKRRGRQVGLPVFKSKRDTRKSVRFSKNGFRLRENGRLNLARVGDVRVCWSRPLPSAPSSVTVIKDSAGRYFASFVVEVEPCELPPAESEVGIALGLTTYAVLSNGTRFLRRAERKPRKAQQALSRKAKGSKNRDKARVRVARAHARVADVRRDWCHRTVSRLVRDSQAVYLEDLAVCGLARTRMAKSVHDAAWGMFRRLLEEKAALYCRHMGVVSRWLPSSQTCRVCWVVDGKKPLQVCT
ncbi:RNA-guided endonuclease InsQ/TnpB family protein [Streptomyces sp. NPDC086835]|uniref:RNA-guided endonuclease InsQ/TnpB family protein n=1 Tax=Streptomyces sp. NPDC086835 TaxID=3365761 RepID=UPI00382B63CF